MKNNKAEETVAEFFQYQEDCFVMPDEKQIKAFKTVPEKSKIENRRVRKIRYVPIIAACLAIIVSIVSVIAVLELSENDIAISNVIDDSHDSSNRHEDIDIDRIFELGGQYVDEFEFNHKNIISTSTVHYIDATAQSERKISLDGIEHSLKYKDTIHYLVGDKIVHTYVVDGNEDDIVLIDANDNIQSILYKYLYLNFSKNASPDEVLELLKPELNKIFNLFFYENIDIKPSYDSTKTKVRFYDYMFYNIQNGYITDYLLVSVASDGGVHAIKQHDLATKDFTVDINKDKENAAIEAKLKDIYNTDSTEYISSQRYGTPRISIYDNQICVVYDVSADYLDKKCDVQISGFRINLLIPLDLISN